MIKTLEEMTAEDINTRLTQLKEREHPDRYPCPACYEVKILKDQLKKLTTP